MLERVGDDYVVKLGLLFAQRLCLRAQHYVKTRSKDIDILCYGSINFHPKAPNALPCSKVSGLTYYNRHDKNHAKGEDIRERTIYCTCGTEWTCLPCYAVNYL